MTKIIEIEYCNNCPSFATPKYCFETGEMIPIIDTQIISYFVIPSWCPLSDKEVKK
jgi:hypothetical protein